MAMVGRALQGLLTTERILGNRLFFIEASPYFPHLPC
jgi:hypothetical protein